MYKTKNIDHYKSLERIISPTGFECHRKRVGNLRIYSLFFHSFSSALNRCFMLFSVVLAIFSKSSIDGTSWFWMLQRFVALKGQQ